MVDYGVKEAEGNAVIGLQSGTNRQPFSLMRPHNLVSFAPDLASGSQPDWALKVMTDERVLEKFPRLQDWKVSPEFGPKKITTVLPKSSAVAPRGVTDLALSLNDQGLTNGYRRELRTLEFENGDFIRGGVRANEVNPWSTALPNFRPDEVPPEIEEKSLLLRRPSFP